MTDVVAILAVRNEQAYLWNCLRHLVRNGVRFAVIDNDSTDASPEIYRSPEFADHLIGVWRLPFKGVFSLEEQLQLKMTIAAAIDADWTIHLDADEMLHSARPGETLAAGLRRLEADGWNAVDFDEFVFLPIEHAYGPCTADFPDVDLYYFFQPLCPRLMRAWRSGHGLTLSEDGHTLRGDGLQLAPESFALRHYIVRDQDHALQKYVTRVFAHNEAERGWHHNRIGHARDAFYFPDAGRLKRIPHPQARVLDKTDPWRVHFWETQ